MATVLNTGAVVQCQHQAPLVILSPSQTRLRVDGLPALVQTDLTAAKFVGCQNKPPCVTVQTIDQGLATRLRVGTDPVVLNGVRGTTQSQASWSVTSSSSTSMEAA